MRLAVREENGDPVVTVAAVDLVDPSASGGLSFCITVSPGSLCALPRIVWVMATA